MWWNVEIGWPVTRFTTTRSRSSSTGRNSEVAVYTSSWVISSARTSYCHTAHPRSSPRSRNTNESRVAGIWATSNWSALGLVAEVWAVAAVVRQGLASSRKQGQRIGLQDRLLVRVAERQRQELVDVVPHVFHARARPVGAPEDPIRELRETRKVLQQPGGRYPGHVEPHPPVASQNEKRLLHVQDRKSTRLNSSHQIISYAVFCLKKKKYRRHYDIYV